MKIKREKLISILDMIKPGIASTDIVDQATHFIFTGSKILTYNDRICICYPLETEFKGSVPNEEFHKILNKMSGDEIEIKEKDGKLKFSSGKLKVEMVIFQEDKIIKLVNIIDIPDIKSKDWRVLPDNFIQAISFCLFSTSKGGIFSSVLVDDDRIISSDDDRITLYYLSSGLKENFLLPVSSMGDFVKIKNMKQYIIKGSWIYFKNKDDIVFACKLGGDIDKWPSVEKIDDLFEFDYNELTFPSELKKSLEGVIIFADGDDDSDKIIEITIQDNEIICYGRKEIGNCRSEDKIKYDGDPIKFEINPKYLIEILGQTDSMRIGPNKALFITDDFEHLLGLIQ